MKKSIGILYRIFVVTLAICIFMCTLSLNTFADDTENTPKIGLEKNVGKYKITYEAEAASSDANYDFTGGTTAIEKSYTVNCADEGDYYFSVFYQKNYNGSGKIIEVYVGEEKAGEFETLCYGYQYETDGIPTTFATIPVKVALKKGVNTITLKFTGKYAFDKCELTNYERAFNNENELSEYTIDVEDVEYTASPRIYSSRVYEEIPFGEASGNVKILWSDKDEKPKRDIVLAGLTDNNEIVWLKTINKQCTGRERADLIEFDNVSFEDISLIRVFIFESFDTLTPLAEADRLLKYPAKNYVTTYVSENITRLCLTTPENIQHRDLGGDNGQQTYAIAISPFDSNIVLKGTDTVGVWRTTDSGETWYNTSKGMVYPYVNDLIFDPLHNGVVYQVQSAKQKNIDNGYTDMGIYKSTDNGATWALDLYSKYVLTGLGRRKQLFIQEYEENTYLYAATMGSGIYRKNLSTDSDWSQIYDGTEIFYDIYADSDGLIIAVSGEKTIQSTDNGASWSDVTVNVDGTDVVLTSIAVYPDDSTMWFGTDTKSLYKSEDSGANWTKVMQQHKDSATATLVNVKFMNYKAEDSEYYRMFLFSRQLSGSLRYSDDLGATVERPAYTDEYGVENSGGYWAWTFDTASDGNFYGVLTGLCRSDDGGASWIYKSSGGLAGYPLTDIAFDEYGGIQWMSFVDAGVYKADDCNEQGELYPVIEEVAFVRHDSSMSSAAVVVDPNNSQHILAGTGKYGYGSTTEIVQSFDGGTSWAAIGDGAVTDRGNDFIRYNPKNSQMIFTDRHISTDNGQTWVELTMPVEEVSSTTQDENGEDVTTTISYTTRIEDISKNGRLLAYSKDATKGAVWISDDNGASWEEIYRLSSSTVNYAMLDTSDDNYVWLNSYRYLYKINIDTGVATQMGGDTSFYLVRKMGQNPNNPKHMIAVVRNLSSYRIESNRVLETTDGGATWNDLEGYEKISYANSVIFHPTEPVAYIGTYTGILVYDFE